MCVRARAFLLSGVAHCLSAAKWMLLHTFFPFLRFFFFFSPSLALVFEFKHRPCKAFRIVMAIQTHSYTYFNVMHGIFLMNSIVLGSINTSQLTKQSKAASKQVYHCYCCLHLFFSFFFVHKSYENRYISCIV